MYEIKKRHFAQVKLLVKTYTGDVLKIAEQNSCFLLHYLSSDKEDAYLE